MSRPGLQAPTPSEKPRPSAARDEQRAARRTGLVQAAIRAIGRHGPTTSMAQMAAEAGVTKPILYRHFADRSELVAAITLRYLDELRLELAKVDTELPLRERTQRQFELGLAYLERRPGLLVFIDRERGFAVSAEREGEHAEGLLGIVRTLVASRGLDPRLAQPLAHGIGGMILAATVAWVSLRETRPEEALPLDHMAAAATDLIFAGIEGLLDT